MTSQEIALPDSEVNHSIASLMVMDDTLIQPQLNLKIFSFYKKVENEKKR